MRPRPALRAGRQARVPVSTVWFRLVRVRRRAGHGRSATRWKGGHGDPLQALLADVATEVHAFEMDLVHRGVGVR